MKLTNTKKAATIKLIYMLIPLLAVAVVTMIYLFTNVHNLLPATVAFFSLVLFFIVMGLFKFNFIIFYAGPDKIRVRFKNLTPFGSENNSIKIASDTFRKYEIKTSLFGKRKVLILYQQTPGGLAKYPAIGLSAVSEQDIKKIKKSLDLVLAINKNKKR